MNRRALDELSGANLQLIAVLQKEMSMGVIFGTYDMGVVKVSPTADAGLRYRGKR